MEWSPAKLNGFPVESHAQRKIQYSYDDPQPVRTSVVQAFKAVNSAIEKSNESDARVSLVRILSAANKSSSESIASYLAEYKIENKWGSPLEAYSAIRAAESGGEKAFLDFNPDMYLYFLVELFRTQVSLGRLGDALITSRKIENSTINRRIKDSVLAVTSSIRREQSGKTPIKSKLLTNDFGFEQITLLRSNKFSIESGIENIKEMRLACKRKNAALVVRQDWMYEIHEPDGDCVLYFLGSRRTEVTVAEY